MSFTQEYYIKRKGAQFVRLEWPDGTPVKGPRMMYNENNQLVPRKDKNGNSYIRVTYGASRFDRITGAPIPNFRDRIRLTAEGARKLRHLDLSPILGTMQGTPVTKFDTTDPNPQLVKSVEIRGVEIPSNWLELSPGKKSSIACQLLGKQYRSMSSDESGQIIQSYLDTPPPPVDDIIDGVNVQGEPNGPGNSND